MPIPAALSKEVGAGPLRLPLWGWAIAGVGGVFVARKITGSSPSSTASSAGSSTPETPADAGSDLPAGGILTLGANGAIGVPGGALSPVANQITDNDQWRTAAINALVSANYDALFASSAIGKYLDGDPLTANEQIAISFALTRIGPTPTPPPPVIPIVTPPPATIGPLPPDTFHLKFPPKVVQQSTPAKPKPALPANHLPGEAFVDFANAPNGGTWWLTNWGGVYAMGAPYKGNPIGNRVSKRLGAAPAGQTFTSIDPLDAGYRIHDNRADTGDYSYR